VGTTSRDTRWFAFGLLVLGLVLVIYGGLAEWLAYGDYYGRREIWGGSYEIWVWSAVPLIALGAGIVFAMAVGARRNYLPAPAVFLVLAILSFVALVAAILAISHASGMVVDRRMPAADPSWGRYDYRSAPVKFSIAPWLALIGLAATAGATTWLGWITRGVRLRAARDLERLNREQAKLSGMCFRPPTRT
jgi:hypothetical protein